MNEKTVKAIICDAAFSAEEKLDGAFEGMSFSDKVQSIDGEIDIDDIRYIDADGDGYGSSEQSPADGVFNSLDCDDTNPLIHPYAKENKENGIDDDCDGIVDEII